MVSLESPVLESEECFLFWSFQTSLLLTIGHVLFLHDTHLAWFPLFSLCLSHKLFCFHLPHMCWGSWGPPYPHSSHSAHSLWVFSFPLSFNPLHFCWWLLNLHLQLSIVCWIICSNPICPKLISLSSPKPASVLGCPSSVGGTASCPSPELEAWESWVILPHPTVKIPAWRSRSWCWVWVWARMSHQNAERGEEK